MCLTGCSLKSKAPAYGTPEETFKTWQNAAETLNLEVLLSCYVLDAQAELRKEFSESSSAQLKAMQAETRDTRFRVEKVLFDGPRAFLRVRRSRGSDVDVEVVNMVLERGAWKLLP